MATALFDAPTGGLRLLRWSSFVLALVGLGISLYLTYEHYTGSTSLACPDTGRVNCAKVTTSQYSHVVGIPVAVLGLLFYLALVILTSPAAWRSARASVRWARLVAVSVGMAFALYLVFAELYRVGAICLWCTAVHVVTLLCFMAVVFAEALREP
jgi:uncharacterized membrane protein